MMHKRRSSPCLTPLVALWLGTHALACAEDHGEGDGLVPTASTHGLPPASEISALSTEERVALCVETHHRTFAQNGTEEQECTASALNAIGSWGSAATSEPGPREDIDCETRVAECLVRRPPFVLDEEDIEDNCRRPAFGREWLAGCHATVNAYDACVDAIARFHGEHITRFSCEQEDDPPSYSPFADLPECAALKAHGECGVRVPTSLQGG